jgi:hypothetical protein
MISPHRMALSEGSEKHSTKSFLTPGSPFPFFDDHLFSLLTCSRQAAGHSEFLAAHGMTHPPLAEDRLDAAHGLCASAWNECPMVAYAGKMGWFYIPVSHESPLARIDSHGNLKLRNPSLVNRGPPPAISLRFLYRLSCPAMHRAWTKSAGKPKILHGEKGLDNGRAVWANPAFFYVPHPDRVVCVPFLNNRRLSDCSLLHT